MKSANLQSSTDPFIKKLKRLCTQPFIFIAAAPEGVGFIWSILCWWNCCSMFDFYTDNNNLFSWN